MKRKVLFRKWIPTEYKKNETGGMTKVEGTGVLEKEFENKGIFHGFGFSMEEDEQGFTNYSVAIIEDEEGLVREVLPSNMKFSEKEKPILKEENFEIDFDGKLMAEFKILNGKIEVLKAMDGCGKPIKVEEIEIIYKK